jgi:hypothetical protein
MPNRARLKLEANSTIRLNTPPMAPIRNISDDRTTGMLPVPPTGLTVGARRNRTISRAKNGPIIIEARTMIPSLTARIPLTCKILAPRLRRIPDSSVWERASIPITMMRK